MLQIILFLAGLALTVKKRTKITANRELTRPNSIYLGSIFIVCAIVISFFPVDGPYNLTFFLLPLLATIFFATKGEKIDTADSIKESGDTKRNTVILLGFIALIVVAFYLLYMLF